MIPRGLTVSLLQSLRDSPVVFLQGARQTGKSTLVQALAAGKHPARYLTLDHAGVLAAAREDPQAFVAGLSGPTIIDEMQRAPELASAIKASVDARREAGRFLLTGSASVLLLPKISDALVGRVEIHTLWPFTQGEILGRPERFIDDLFSRDYSPASRPGGGDRNDLIDRIVLGGYPGVLQRRGHERRRAWFGSYITTLLQRDVRDISNIEGLTAVPRLLSLLGARSGSLLNSAEVSRSLSMPVSTLKRYMALLETTFLVQLLPAWSSNLGKRLVKSPKVLIVDSGLLCHLIGADAKRLAADATLLGHVLESFVVMELRKQQGWSRVRPEIYHYRTATGGEVDVVLETPAGEIVGIEVKASSTVKAGDFKGLKALRDLVGRRFRRGIVLYPGREPLAFGANLMALPLATLWSKA